MKFSCSLDKSKELVASKNSAITKNLIEVKDLVKDLVKIKDDVEASKQGMYNM